MLSILAAAAVATAAPSSPTVERTPNLYSRPVGCPDERRNVVDRFGRPVPTRLGDLPLAGPMLLVERRIDGCPVITLMSVERPAKGDPQPRSEARPAR